MKVNIVHSLSHLGNYASKTRFLFDSNKKINFIAFG